VKLTSVSVCLARLDGFCRCKRLRVLALHSVSAFITGGTALVIHASPDD
jgi:hypothetical protein